MNKKAMIKRMRLILCAVLIAAMALFTTGCNDSKSTDVAETSAQVTTLEQSTTESEDSSEIPVLGEGETQFTFSVTDQDGNESLFEVHNTFANKHGLTQLKNLYADNYINNDGFNKDAYFKSIEETWKACEDLTYSKK